MRRSILVAVLAGALVGLAVAAGISLAGSGGSSGSSSSSQQASSGGAQGSFASNFAAKQGNRSNGRRGGRLHGHRGHGLGFGPLGIAFRGLADKLGVTPAQLREAAQGVKKRTLDRAVSDGTISQAERDALDACIKSHGRGSGCDRKTARAAHSKLHKALKQRARTDLAGIKSQLIDDLAAELPGGKSAAEVEAAMRATLVDLLDKGVKFGLVSEKGRELAIGCFDDPANCDRAALKAEIKKRFRGRGHGHRHGGRRAHP